ncbi:MAG: hypothetical protein IPM82_32630 [Saprospiraceae bacterium]|nr:hypothetical protein [Saprospiraceae bacterium]
MRKLVPVLALMTFCNWLSAQITVTTATFPVAGDTLKTATDLNPDGIVITPPGRPATWDFTRPGSNLSSPSPCFRAASEGSAFADFSSAELFSVGAGGTRRNLLRCKRQ